MISPAAEINSKHERAMDLTVVALQLQDSDASAALTKFREAFLLEREAADGVADATIEPTRAVLHRSAATLALDCGEIAEAVRIANRGLTGNPPADIADELQKVLQRAGCRSANKAIPPHD